MYKDITLMIKSLLIFFVICSLFFGCASTYYQNNVDIEKPMVLDVIPEENEYKEITLKDFWEIAESHLNSNINQGYKISNVYIETTKARNEILFNIGNSTIINATEFVNEISQMDSTWFQRFICVTAEGQNNLYTELYGHRQDAWKDWENDRYNGKLTLYVYKKRSFGISQYYVYKIDGVPTQEQFDADKIEFLESLGYKSFEEYELSILEESKQEEQRKNLRIFLSAGIPIPSINIGDKIFIDKYTSFQMRVFNVNKKENYYEYIVGYYESTSQSKKIYIISKKDLKETYTLKYIGNANYSVFNYYGEEKTINTYVFERID